MTGRAGRRRFGAVRRLPSGRYQARYRTPDGRRHAASQTFATKADADRYLNRVEMELARGQWIDPSLGRELLGAWARRYMATTVHLKPKTRASYESLLRTTILPTFEQLPLSAIRPSTVREWVAALSARQLSPSRIRQAYNLLCAMLVMAVTDGRIATTPCVGVKLPRLPAPKLRYLSAEQVAELAAAMRPPYGLLVEVLAYGGLRFGEAAALRRGRCDLLHGRLLVAEALAEVNGRLLFGPPKGHQERTVALPASVVAALAEHLAASVAADPAALVFTAPDGGPLRYSNFRRRAWNPAARAAGLAGATPHLLRHTAASLLLDAGASVKDVQRQLGHADAAVTLNVYSAVIEGRSDDLAERLEGIRQAAATRRYGTRGARGPGGRRAKA
jgi:integrase